LEIKKPNLHPDDAYTQADVLEAALFLLQGLASCQAQLNKSTSASISTPTNGSTLFAPAQVPVASVSPHPPNVTTVILVHLFFLLTSPFTYDQAPPHFPCPSSSANHLQSSG
jgi:hypothetical protein